MSGTLLQILVIPRKMTAAPRVMLAASHLMLAKDQRGGLEDTPIHEKTLVSRNDF